MSTTNMSSTAGYCHLTVTSSDVAFGLDRLFTWVCRVDAHDQRFLTCMKCLIEILNRPLDKETCNRRLGTIFQLHNFVKSVVEYMADELFAPI